MRINWKEVKLAILVVVAELLFTSIVYNIKFGEYIYRYACIGLFYSVASYLLFFKIKPGAISLFLLLAPPILIDASVLFTFPAIIPLRFPYASTFPILGVAGGYLLHKKRILFLSGFVILVIGYCIAGKEYLIPKILYSINTRAEKIQLNDSFSRSVFLDGNNIRVRLDSFFTAKINLVECYFVGCPPCDQKFIMLQELRKTYSKEELNIIFICDGTVTDRERYASNLTQMRMDGAVFLYDVDSTIQKSKISVFPTELLFRRDKMVASSIGYVQTAKQMYLKEKTTQLNKLLK